MECGSCLVQSGGSVCRHWCARMSDTHIFPIVHPAKGLPDRLAMALRCCRRSAWYRLVPGPRPALVPSRLPIRVRPLLLPPTAHPVRPHAPTLSLALQKLFVSVRSRTSSQLDSVDSLDDRPYRNSVTFAEICKQGAPSSRSKVLKFSTPKSSHR